MLPDLFSTGIILVLVLLELLQWFIYLNIPVHSQSVTLVKFLLLSIVILFVNLLFPSDFAHLLLSYSLIVVLSPNQDQ